MALLPALHGAAALAQAVDGEEADALEQFLQDQGLAQGGGAPGFLLSQPVMTLPSALEGASVGDAGVPYAPSAPPAEWTPSAVVPLMPFIAPQAEEERSLTLAATPEEKMGNLVVMAMSFIDLPYRRGGTSRETGFDCSGFVRSIFEVAADVALPRTSAGQATVGQSVRKGDLRPGDLVFFNTSRRRNSHVGIYVGDGKFIHSPSAGSRIRIESMDGAYWKRRFNGARRIPLTPA